MMRRALPAAAAMMAALSAEPARAQSNYMAMTTYDVSWPVGDTHKYSPSTSWIGFGWEARWLARPHASIGAAVGWNEFHERESGTFNFPAGAATGEQYRHLLSIYIAASGHWYASRNAMRGLFLGGDVGFGKANQSFQLGIEDRRRASWHASVAPEIGYVTPLMEGIGGTVSARYYLPTRGGDYLGGGARMFQYFSIRLGVRYRG